VRVTTQRSRKREGGREGRRERGGERVKYIYIYIYIYIYVCINNKSLTKKEQDNTNNIKQRRAMLER
jgi:hypothetical protein